MSVEANTVPPLHLHIQTVVRRDPLYVNICLDACLSRKKNTSGRCPLAQCQFFTVFHPIESLAGIFRFE